MSLIVVEGVDASGKSTLLENARLDIKKRYFVIARHSQRPYVLSDALHFMRATKYASDLCALDLICDRHPLISEPIYGPLLRGGHLFESHGEYCEPEARAGYFADNVERIIYCRPPDHIIEENLGRLPQLAGIKEKIWELLDAYDKEMAELMKCGIPVIVYDYTIFSGSLADLFFGSAA